MQRKRGHKIVKFCNKWRDEKSNLTKNVTRGTTFCLPKDDADETCYTTDFLQRLDGGGNLLPLSK